MKTKTNNSKREISCFVRNRRKPVILCFLWMDTKVSLRSLDVNKVDNKLYYNPSWKCKPENPVRTLTQLYLL